MYRVYIRLSKLFMLKCILLIYSAQSILCINQRTLIISLHIPPAGSSAPSSRILRTTSNLWILFQTRLESYELSAHAEGCIFNLICTQKVMSKYMKYDRIYKIPSAHETGENVGSVYGASTVIQAASRSFGCPVAEFLGSLLILSSHDITKCLSASVKPSRVVYLQRLFSSIDLRLVNAELLVLVSKVIVAVTSDVT